MTHRKSTEVTGNFIDAMEILARKYKYYTFRIVNEQRCKTKARYTVLLLNEGRKGIAHCVVDEIFYPDKIKKAIIHEI